jgi:phage terminase large subunit-like protein
VTATVGKRLRATPVATAVETNKVSHVGTLPDLELELTTWQEGDPSPGRLDAYVWLVTRLLAVRRGSSSTVANQTVPTAPRS